MEKFKITMAMPKKCPYCGSLIYYVKEKYVGSCNYYGSLDNEKIDGDQVDILNLNSDIYLNATHTRKSKFAFCGDCDKKLFVISKIESK